MEEEKQMLKNYFLWNFPKYHELPVTQVFILSPEIHVITEFYCIETFKV
jgi:hypothetical protein